MLGDEIGARLRRSCTGDHGVDLRLSTGVRVLRAARRRLGCRRRARTRADPADIVVVGIGARPATELAEAAGLAVDNGVVVDASLRTSDPDIFAAGDVAYAFNPLLGRHLRVEHWANALNGGPAPREAMLGQDVTYDRVPYFFSDQYDLGMEYSACTPRATTGS